MLESIESLLEGVPTKLFLDQIYTIDGVEVTGEEIYKKRIGDSE